ncbi:hypothetical protein D3C87_1529720 [compost metagenome]
MPRAVGVCIIAHRIRAPFRLQSGRGGPRGGRASATERGTHGYCAILPHRQFGVDCLRCRGGGGRGQYLLVGRTQARADGGRQRGPGDDSHRRRRHCPWQISLRIARLHGLPRRQGRRQAGLRRAQRPARAGARHHPGQPRRRPIPPRGLGPRHPPRRGAVGPAAADHAERGLQPAFK